MLVAKLVYTSFLTRVIVEDNANDDMVIAATKIKLLGQVNNELTENLEKIVDDTECPYNPETDTKFMKCSSVGFGYCQYEKSNGDCTCTEHCSEQIIY